MNSKLKNLNNKKNWKRKNQNQWIERNSNSKI